ncbi:hypothetical protein RB623_19935 [Mesorhizobium sp. LHD-90]|uniref:hypothetical protein n=1 Tax=Mesorhizobium sp. LHD-90 TaxID=3071414 RepID=UPI0027DF309A|nr:hypothetical protein [Mesorhizobium sp. LHD-90]MDQ6436334.1 hypothetical protein [Mesorhizobium sp. LHD-90]
MNMTKGLIIDDPWIGFILDGSKTWEMRSTGASHRGWFALIRKGTGAVWGVARLVDSGAPLSPDDMIAAFEKHRIPAEMIRSGQVAKWNTPWKLADVRKLSAPVPYRHKSGAVTWVELDERASSEIVRQLGSISSDAKSETTTPAPTTGFLQKVRDVSASKPTVPSPAAPSAAGIVQAKPVPSNGHGRVIGEVAVTQGNIDHNHIYLRSIFDRFPADAKGGSNKASAAKKDIIVDWGGPEPVRTDLDGEKKFFRARGWIGSFYKLNRAKTGDKVRFEETAPYRYRVSLVR